MDPASLTLGAVATIIELYRFSMKTYDLYISVQDFTPTFGTIRLQLDIERKRLELWAQYMGIDRESGTHERLQKDPALLDIVKAIMTNMTATLQDGSKMLEDYADIVPLELGKSEP